MRRLKYWVTYAWWRLRAFVFDHLFPVTLVLLILGAAVTYFVPDIVVNVDAGESGVLWRRFHGGTMVDQEDGRPFVSRIRATRRGIPEADQMSDARAQGLIKWPYDEGFHLKWPWDKVFIYNMRLQETSATYDALTNDGLALKVEVTIRWKPVEEDLGKLHRDIGPDYVKTLLVPLVGSFARQEIAAHKPDSLYSGERLSIQERIREKTIDALVSRFNPEDKRESYLMVEDVLIRDVQLPEAVAQAIESKVIQKHEAEAYEYRLTRERQEADRKAIEAEGIRRFQETINATISEGYLKWKGIEATLELAKSPNAKIVVIGSGKDGLPIILGGLDGASPQLLQSKPAPASKPAAKPSPATP